MKQSGLTFLVTLYVDKKPCDTQCCWKFYSRSLKVIWIYTVEYGLCKFLLQFHFNYLLFLG